jgi:crotonobetainyl-CoA:carnitine CoA-transferase CaiB-like acyl-CoA transferase
MRPIKGTPDPLKTSDGYIVIAPLTDKHWSALLEGIGHPDWLDGEDSRAEKVRKAMWKIIELFPSKPSAHWLEIIEKADVPCAPVNDFDTIWKDPQFVANETFAEYEHPKAGKVRAVRSPARFSRTKPELWRHAPDLGEHTDQILADFGFSKSEVSGLRAAQIVR